jgi:hypothetical protein
MLTIVIPTIRLLARIFVQNPEAGVSDEPYSAKAAQATGYMMDTATPLSWVS